MRKISAAALKSRGLATVIGHGRSWTATITDSGTHYLEHGTYPPSDEPSVAVIVASHSRRTTPPTLDLGTQPKTRAPPMAGLSSVTYLATHLRPMSRLITWWT